MAHFTDEEINQILQEFYERFADRTYVGARYVPIVGRRGESSAAWDDTKPYEPLTIVLYEGNSYTSKQYVPAGIDILNTDFWAQTGNYNAQLASYQQEVEGWQQETAGDIDAIGDDIDAINNNRENDLQFIVCGGNGTLIRNLEAVQEDTSLGQYAQFLQTSKRDNTLNCSIRLRNTSGASIHASTPLIRIKHGKTRYSTVVLPFMTAINVYDPDVSVTDAANRILLKTITARTVWYSDPDSDDAFLRTTYAMPDNSEIAIDGSGSIAGFQNWFNAPFYDAQLAADLCDYFLNGDGETSWKGEFRYGTGQEADSVRLNPVNRITDCSGMTYIAYNGMGFHPDYSVQPAYVSDGIFVAYAKAGEKLDVSNARPGDIICYQDPERDANTRQSWTHCSLYVGNDKTYEMADTYPQIEREHGAINGYGPFDIYTPASEYRMANRNRCIVRFM